MTEALKTLAILRQFNEWRRCDYEPSEQPAPPDPHEIGEAIDAAVEMIERLEAAEKSDAESLAMYRKARDERDALRAEIDKLNVQNSAMLKALLAIADWNSAWGPFPEKNEHWRAMAIVTAREATKAFEQGEQK